MNFLSKTALRAVTGLVLFGSSVALAQTGYSRATVPADAPFGSLAVNVSDLRPAAAAELVASLPAAELADLNARCDVVIDGPLYYGMSNVGFCTRVLGEQDLLPDDEDLGENPGSGAIIRDSSSSSS